MEAIELTFKNKRVRMWFLWVLPIIFLSVTLYFLLPIEYHWIPSFLVITGIIIFYGWVKFDKKKNRR